MAYYTDGFISLLEDNMNIIEEKTESVNDVSKEVSQEVKRKLNCDLIIHTGPENPCGL
jgi:hypothetical protein